MASFVFVAAGLTATSAGNSHLPASVRSEDVLDQLTQRITGKLPVTLGNTVIQCNNTALI